MLAIKTIYQMNSDFITVSNEMVYMSKTYMYNVYQINSDLSA